ncbi:MAG: Hsp20/alpha crystallin family protein [Planctomycetota bacterium]|jgi:HSP20 family protein
MAWLPWRRGRKADVEHPVTRFRNEMDRMFENYLGGWLPATLSGEGPWGPALDVRETENEVIVDVEIPGLEPADLDVSVTDGRLTVKGEKKLESEETRGDYRLAERSYGSFSRSVSLPAPVEVEKAEAVHKQGVLTITLPKTEKSKAKKIEVKPKPRAASK